MAQTQAFIGETYTIFADSVATGLSDLTLKVLDPSGTQITGSPFTMTEIVAGEKVYKCDIVPAVAGAHLLRLLSPTETAIDGRLDILTVMETSKSDIVGSGYDSAQHSLKQIADKIDAVAAASANSANGFVGQ